MAAAIKTGVMTGGAAIVEALIANGVDTVFGLPGAQMYPFFDALKVHSDRIRTIGARHEQTCAATWRSATRARRGSRACSRWCRDRAC